MSADLAVLLRLALPAAGLYALYRLARWQLRRDRFARAKPLLAQVDQLVREQQGR